ncbi:MAG: penicillin-binding transpeptidase domain-containing protein, partial [Bacillota bacterium]
MGDNQQPIHISELDEPQAWRLRFRSTAGFTLIAMLFLALTARLFWIATVAADQLTAEALAQRTSHVPVSTEQTQILDRNLIPLGLTEKRLYAAVSGEAGLNQLAKAISALTGKSLGTVLGQMEGPYQGAWLWPDPLNEAQWAALRGEAVAGLVPVLRDHVTHMLATHLVGGPQAVLIGCPVNGIARVAPVQSLAIPHDAVGQPLSGLVHLATANADAKPRDLVTTIDGQIQSMVEQVMSRTMERGAVVVMEPKSGDILAMASAPGYHPDDLAEIISANPNSAPLLNRALSFYPPGSVFKLLVAGAALEEGSIHADDRFYCPGYAQIGDVRIACTGYHGEMGLEQAIMESCNAAFVEIGSRLGYTDWRHYAELL